jgi:hypothetical protein
MNRRILENKNEFGSLEAHLAGTLKPVAPPNDFIQRLKSRVRIPDTRQIQVRLRDWRTLLYVFGGVMSGVLLIVTVARAFYYMSSRRG